MPETTGHPCPECGAPRGADNSPSCSCAERAAEALRDTRTAEAAAAEDFDPLRIRPYVELEGSAGAATEQAVPAAPDATMTLRTVTPPAPDATMTLRAVAPPAPDADSVGLFDAEAPAGLGTGPGPGTGPDAAITGPGPGPGPGPGELPDRAEPETGADGCTDAPPRRSRRTALLVGSAAAVVAVIAGAAFASGVFSYDPPSRNGSDAGDVRAGVPAASASASGAASVSPGASASASAAESADASPSASESGSPSPSASGSESASASASASASGTPSPSATATGATATAQPQYGTGSGPVLRPGDSGSEVTELQLRLKQLYLFAGTADGDFDKQLEDSVRAYQWTRGLDKDPKGVYGAETRAALERETSQP